MTQWVFIVGWNKDEAGYKGLQEYVQTFYTGRLPKGTPFFASRWDHDVTAEINAKYPTGDIGIIAHSFGGQKAIEVCNELARPVKKLILLDPVDYHNAATPNSVGFAVPRNVLAARCFYRQKPSAAPWSGNISSPQIVNTMYVPTTSDPHGEYVWNSSTMNEVKASL